MEKASLSRSEGTGETGRRRGGLGESQVASALVGLAKEMKRGLWGKG